MPRRDLTEKERECTNNLKRLWLELSREQGISQKKLADEWGVTQATVCQYLNGAIPLNTSKKLLFAKALGVSVDEIDSGLSDARCEKVPLLSWDEASTWCQGDDSLHQGARRWSQRPLPCVRQHSKKTFALIVSGDSMMSPNAGQVSYPEGTTIFIDPEVKPFNGCKVIAKAPSGKLTFKTYVEDAGRTYLMPLNPKYPTIDITDYVHVCGVVIGLWVDI